MHRSLIPVCATACVVAICMTFSRVSPSTAADPVAPIYAQLSSPVTQDPKAIGTPMLVEMTSNDALGGIDHSDKEKTTEIKVKTAGVYFVVAAVQVGKEGAAGGPGDYLDIWVKQNGKDVDNSNCRQVIHDPKYTSVLVCQGVAECKAGDTFNVAISASAPGVGIKAIKPAGEPVVPSIIFSMYKIN